MDSTSTLFVLLTAFGLATSMRPRSSLSFPSSRVGVHASCKLNSGEPGTCRAISECPAVLNQLQSVTPTHCGWNGREPLVCCPGPPLATENTCARSNHQVSSRAAIRWKREASSNESITNETTDRDTAKNSSGKQSLIVGGKLSEPNSRPWMVAIALRVDNPELTARDKLVCGGALIGTQHILTAAHCFGISTDPREYEIYFGVNVLNSTEKGVPVASITIHPKFTTSRLYNDIAIMKLVKGITFSESVRPVCLPMGDLRTQKFENVQCIVAGWGIVDYQSFSSVALREVELNVVPNKECNKSISLIPQLMRVYPRGALSPVLCAGVNDERKDACQGDSGGPLVWTDPQTHRWVVLGIVSGGYKCGIPGLPGVYTRVTTYLDWIIENAT